MNYYEHHIGDYDSATAHLSVLEDGVYSRLLRVYYRTEHPIPADVKQACRLIRAASKQERDTVRDILGEFFDLRDDGWHNKRCDEDLERYHQAAPDREAKKENAAERQRLTRERRKLLFELLRSHGIVPAYDTPMSQLQALASQLPSQPVTRDVTPPVTCDATATHTQTPDTSHQTKTEARIQPDAPPEPDLEGFTPTPAGAVCKAMRQAGLQQVNPGDPRLLALLQQGATEAEFVGLATEAVAKGKGWPWVLAVLQARRAEAAAIALAPPAPPQRTRADERADIARTTTPSREADSTRAYLREQAMTPDERERATKAAREARAKLAELAGSLAGDKP